jgi:inositol hexakisphosphate/diphosphoinositol-pentakisphosphate kinase
MINRKLVIGVCAMDSKARSKPMREILDRLIYNDEFEVMIFGDKVILDEDVSSWPACDFLISFHSKGFPLTKAIEYVKLREPICLNDLLMQPLLWDRRLVLQVLDKANVPTPNRIISNIGNDYPHFSPDMLKKISEVGIELVNHPSVVIQIDSETILLGSSILKKPFVEKPVNGDDHNVSTKSLKFRCICIIQRARAVEFERCLERLVISQVCFVRMNGRLDQEAHLYTKRF